MDVSNFLIQTDKFLDIIPFGSIGNNLIDLFLKCVFLPCLSPFCIKANRYFTYLSQKSFQHCLILLLPFIGNAIHCNYYMEIPEIKLTVEEVIKQTRPIQNDFTTKTSIEKQRLAHADAKAFLKEHLAGAEFISHSKTSVSLKGVTIGALNPAVFARQSTKGVLEDIKKDGKRDEDTIVIYSVASQYNGCEAPSIYTIKPGRAVSVYVGDRTQGPQSQLAFPRHQVELINCGGNIGYNALCHVLDEETKGEVAHGYFIPSKAKAGKVIQQLKERGNQIEYPCISNIPLEGNKPVYQILTSAPAFGYGGPETAQGEAKNEIQFLCALHSFRAQFEKAVNLAEEHKKPVVLKVAAIGLGVYENKPEIVADAFYVAATEYQKSMESLQVKVLFQIFNSDKKATLVADALGLAK